MARAPQQLRRRTLLPSLLVLLVLLAVVEWGRAVTAAAAESTFLDEANPYAGVRGIVTRLLGAEKGRGMYAMGASTYIHR